MFDFLKSSGEDVNLEHYTRKNAKFEDGEGWYVQPGDGNRRRVESHARKILAECLLMVNIFQRHILCTNPVDTNL